jgi:hypothetical protein
LYCIAWGEALCHLGLALPERLCSGRDPRSMAVGMWPDISRSTKGEEVVPVMKVMFWRKKADFADDVPPGRGNWMIDVIWQGLTAFRDKYPNISFGFSPDPFWDDTASTDETITGETSQFYDYCGNPRFS